MPVRIEPEITFGEKVEKFERNGAKIPSSKKLMTTTSVILSGNVEKKKKAKESSKSPAKIRSRKSPSESSLKENACTSTIPHHQFDKLNPTPPNGYRKSLVLNGTPTPYTNGSIAERNVPIHKNGYYNGHGLTNGTTTEFPPNANGTIMQGTMSRRALVNGMNGMSQSAREPVYKASPRIAQPPINGKLNGQQNGSPRSSIASYTSYTSNGSNNGPSNGTDHSNGSPKRKSPTRGQSASPTSIPGEDSIVQVRMSPDGQGRYGFNVSGGYDRGHPVIVSRVIAGSPADRCHPRLNEGDQVLKINGQDISTWNYDRVVNYIRSVRTSSILGEINLLIKPNVYRWGELDESDSQQTSLAEIQHVAETLPQSERLAQSLLLLKDAIDSQKIVRQFEQLYRKKLGMTMNDSRTPNNLNKNRYRDVTPYDDTRVLLKKAPTGDYINASHVNMEIPVSGIVNRYIATQGPLANTTGDFWYMVWEQSCTTIVMLTTLVEKGRVKCHQYWPNKKEAQDFGQLQISMLNERSEPHCHYREFAIKNKLTREERRVTQMQYTAWPDHGVPENPKHFIDFVGEVRRARNGSLDPLIVHCSAGIGRTGVLILMETAACLIEANEPVYPFDIVQTMRDQRAMLIQTPDQYVFVTESILRAYNEGSIRPLAEYQKCR